MPNWCTNVLTIKKSVAEEFLLRKDTIKDYKGEHEGYVVDFNILKPMPEELNVTAGGSNEQEMYIYLSDKGQKGLVDVLRDKTLANKFRAFESDVHFEKAETAWMRAAERAGELLKSGKESKIEEAYNAGKVLVENYEKYGSIHWYDWCSKNWGTKWNGGEASIEPVNDEEITISFDTAWCPPEGILEELAKRSDFSLEYDIEGNGHGILEAKGGKIHDHGFEEYTYEEEEEEEK